MSVLIKGMEMPENCDKCRFQSAFRLYCDAMPYNFCGNTDDIERPDFCPLISITTPHGRLGDLDALVKTLEQNRLCYISDIDDESFELGTNRAIDVVRNMNTIIEAERSEE